jgi:hypothetical protein
MGTKIFLLAGLYMMISCSGKEQIRPVSEPAGVQQYIIKKGNHYAEGHQMDLMSKNIISCIVQFDSSAIYETVDKSNQADVNKLIGFSDCGSGHQQNSARIGWSWTAKGLMLYAYAYVNGQRMIKDLLIVSLNAPIHCSLTASGKYYQYNINGFTDSLPRYCDNYSGMRYKLFPYFGGDETAPHDVRIKITETAGGG